MDDNQAIRAAAGLTPVREDQAAAGLRGAWFALTPSTYRPARQSGWGAMLTRDLVAFVRSSLPAQPSRILEIGAGRGELASELDGAGYEVTAIDPAADADSHVQQRSLLEVNGSFDARWPWSCCTTLIRSRNRARTSQRWCLLEHRW